MIRNIVLAGIVGAFLFVTAAAEAQGFYPREWLRGQHGLFSRDYVTPPSDEPGFLIGGWAGASAVRSRGLVFAAASVDRLCQQDGSPRIAVLDSPRSGRISLDLGRFVATAVDAGSHLCLGRTVRGARVHYRGPAARGDRIVLRVTYPVVGARGSLGGLIYDHVIPLR